LHLRSNGYPDRLSVPQVSAIFTAAGFFATRAQLRVVAARNSREKAKSLSSFVGSLEGVRATKTDPDGLGSASTYVALDKPAVDRQE
jgi:hypothetical protein